MAVVPAGALDGALPRHHVAIQEALRLLRDPASSRTWLHDPRTHEAVELMPPPRGALWDIHVVNAEGLAIISSKTEDNWTNSFLSYDVWSVGRDLYVQPRDAGTGAFLVDFVAGSKDMVCAISPRRQNLRVDVDVCPRMIQGARCWWEMPQFWHFLSVDASGTAARLVAARALRWEALTLSLGLPRPHIRRRHEWQRGALPDRASMHRMLPCTSASMHAILTIIRTAAAGVRRHGGLPASLAQDPAERFLESLLRDLYWTSATIRINVDAASELIAGPCIGHCPLFLPLGRCVVDVSALADALRGRSSEARAFRHSRGRAPVEKAESTMQQHVLLVRLLGAGPQLHWLTKQFLWQAGDLLDGIVARTLDTPAVLRARLALAGTEGTPASALLPKAESVHWRNRRPRLQRYFMACREHFDGARSLSRSIDASRVGKKQVFLLALALPDNCSAWAPPQAGRDAGASSPSALTRADGSTRHARARSSRGTGGHASTGGCEQTCPCASASACACAGAGDFSGTRADPRATRCVAAAQGAARRSPRGRLQGDVPGSTPRKLAPFSRFQQFFAGYSRERRAIFTARGVGGPGSSPGALLRTLSAQVARDCRGHLELLQATAREPSVPLLQARPAWRNRAARFLARDPAEAPDAKRPCTKRRRVKTLEWLLALDNGLRVCTGAGLGAFRVAEEPLDTSSGFTWPSLCVAPDQGLDGHCALNWACWGPGRLNIERTDDPSHGAHNDIDLTLRDSGLYAHQLLINLARNIFSFDEGRRHVDTAEAVAEYCALTNPHERPLFEAMLPLLLEDRGEQDRRSEPGTRALGLMYVCLATGAYSEGLIAQAYRERSRLAPQQQLHSEDIGPKKLGAQAVAGMRAATRNQLAIACIMYTNPENRCRQRALRVVGGPTVDWHSAQNQRLQSCPEALRWQTDQAGGRYLEHLRQTWRA